MKNPYTTGLRKVARAWDEGYAAGLRDALAVCMQMARAEYTYYSEQSGGDADVDWSKAIAEVEKRIIDAEVATKGTE